MKLYNVNIPVVGHYNLDVEAESAERAIEKAKEICRTTDDPIFESTTARTVIIHGADMEGYPGRLDIKAKDALNHDESEEGPF